MVFDYDAVVTSGHETEFLGGTLRGMADVTVRQQCGNLVALGSVDFIHGGGRRPLVVFWDRLKIANHEMKPRRGIPRHIWERLAETSRQACATTERYDAHWCDDPLVRAWSRKQPKSNRLR